MTLGEIIKEYRQNNKLSQRKFAKICKLSNGYISMLEDGRNPKTEEPIIPTLVTLKKLADAMNTSLDDLMMMMDEMPVSLTADAAPVTQGTLRIPNEGAVVLNEFELEMLKAFRQIPEDQQKVFLEMGRAYANSLKKD